jgi:hypothetical protein
MFISMIEVKNWAASPGVPDCTARIANEGWFRRGQLTARVIGARHAGFLTELDIFTPGEWDVEPLYHDFWRPQGVGWAMGTAIPTPTGENVSFFLPRRTERGPFERAIIKKLDELRPHLARSALLSARFQLDRARIASETLASIGLPTLVLNEQGNVLAACRFIVPVSHRGMTSAAPLPSFGQIAPKI